jgi:hypothetical protein
VCALPRSNSTPWRRRLMGSPRSAYEFRARELDTSGKFPPCPVRKPHHQQCVVPTIFVCAFLSQSFICGIEAVGIMSGLLPKIQALAAHDPQQALHFLYAVRDTGFVCVCVA